MWPVNVSQLVAATAPDAEPLVSPDGELARRALYRAVAWPNGSAGKQDVLFVVERAMRSEVKAALKRGAIVVAPKDAAPDDEELTMRFLASERPLAAFRRFAAFMRSRLFVPTIAVGGSNGKTTTKEMIVAALSGEGRRITATPGTNNGWVGVPTTLCHPAHTEPLPDALVLEIGIDEKGAMAEHVELARPNIAVLTALGVEHLAGLGSHEEAIREELDLFRAPRRIWNAEEPALAARLDDVRENDLVVHDKARALDVPCPTLAFSWRPARAEGKGELDLFFDGERATLDVPVPGAHNGRNAALAIGTALALGRTLAQAVRGFASFQGPNQRCAITRLPSGCVLIDDTYNASPSSMGAAFDVLSSIEPERPRLVVLGDMLDLGEAAPALHDALAAKIDAIPNAHVRLYGALMSALGPKLENALSIARAPASEDPLSLLDIDALDNHVVLVKGSRGMRLERVVTALRSREETSRLEIAVVGTDVISAANALRAALGSIANIRTAQFPQRLDLVVLTPFTPREDEDAEALLATIAQLFVHLDESAGAVLAKADDEDEAPELLLSVVPSTLAHKHVCESANQISIAISVAHELGRRKEAARR